MNLWHYTTGVHFLQIVEDGVINTATANVPKGERPIVWFSLNQWWEPTVNKLLRNSDGMLVRLDRIETEKYGKGLVRIGVAPETAPYDWKAMRELSGMSSKMAQGMYRLAIEQGARPGEWRGTFEAVPQSQWTAIEIFQDGAWIAGRYAAKGKA